MKEKDKEKEAGDEEEEDNNNSNNNNKYISKALNPSSDLHEAQSAVPVQ